MSRHPRRPGVVVTGLGFITSIGNNAREVLHSLQAMRHGFQSAQLVPGGACPISVFGLVDGFTFPSPNYLTWTHPEGYGIPRDLRRSLAPHGVYAFCAISQALMQAGLDPETVGRGRTGLFCASAGSPLLVHNNVEQMRAVGYRRANPMGVVSAISGTLNFTLGAHFQIEGANCGFVSACASSAHAIGYAMDEIMLGRLDRVIVAAGEDTTAESFLAFMGMRALSRNPDPNTASRPFDCSRDGFVASGGGVCLVLESSESAAARKARPLARLAGWGQSSDGFSAMISHPDGAGLVRAMRQALAAGGTPSEAVDYINAHATSTPAGDAAEARALREVFPAEDCTPPISSTKGLTGHTLSMSGALEAAICVLALQEQIVPGNAQLVTPDPECAGLNLPRQTQPAELNHVLTNSSGFGGSNVSIVLGRA